MKAKQLYAALALLVTLSLAAAGIAVALPGAPPVQALSSTLHVVPFTLQESGGGLAQWTGADFHSGSCSVRLSTATVGDYAAAGFTPVSGLNGFDGTVDSISSLSFWFNCTSWSNWSGPRYSLLLDYSGNGTADHLVVSADVAEGMGSWNEWSPDFGSSEGTNRFWYGTCTGDGGNYTQEAGPVSFNDVKSNLAGAEVVAVAMYLGVVGDPAPGAGTAFVDDPAVNGVTCYGMIQDAIDSAIEGDTVLVHPGTYEEHITIGKSLTVQSSGYAGDTTIRGNGTAPVVTIAGASPFAGTAVLRGFEITGGYAADGVYVEGVLSGASVTVADNLIHHNAEGVHVGQVEPTGYVAIWGNAISDNSEYGMYVDDIDGDVDIALNAIGAFYSWDAEHGREFSSSGNAWEGIYLFHVDGTADINANYILENGLDFGDGIHIKYICGEVDITENSIGAWEFWYDESHHERFSGIQDDGIEIWQVLTGGSLNVAHNLIAENDGDGIDFGDTGYIEGEVTVVNNRIGAYTYRPSLYGQPGPNCTYEGNLGDGIRFDDYTTVSAAGRVVIEQNTISDNGAVRSGIHVGGSMNGRLDIVDNQIGAWDDGLGGSFPGNAGEGIFIAYVASPSGLPAVVTIGNNTIAENGGDGIVISQIVDGYTTVVIQGNTVRDNGTDDVGVALVDAAAGAVVGVCQNLITGHAVGVYLAEATCGVDVTCNSITGNGDGIWVSGDFNTVQGNDITGNNFALRSGVHLTSGADGNEIHYNNITGNSYGVYKEGGTLVDATDNWWGDATGPGAAGGGDGDWVNDYVEFNPWSTQENDTCYDGEDVAPTITMAGSSPSMVSLWLDDMYYPLYGDYEYYSVGPSCFCGFYVEASDAGSGVATVTVDLRDLLIDETEGAGPPVVDGLIPEERLQQWVDQLDAVGLAEWEAGLAQMEAVPLEYLPEEGFWLAANIVCDELLGFPLFFAEQFEWTEEEWIVALGQIMGQELRLGQFEVGVTVTDYKGNCAAGVIPLAVVDYQIPVGEGWNLRSTWIALQHDRWEDIVALDDGLDANSILRWNGEQQRWEQYANGAGGYGWYYGSTYVAPALARPLEAYWIHGVGNDQIGLAVGRGVTSPPTREMYAGWNLVGASLPWYELEMDVDDALVSIYEAPGPLTGYTQVISVDQHLFWEESLYLCGIYEWGNYTKWFEEYPWVFTRGSAPDGRVVTRGGGYWVLMANDAQLAGLSTTPLMADFWYWWLGPGP